MVQERVGRRARRERRGRWTAGAARSVRHGLPFIMVRAAARASASGGVALAHVMCAVEQQ